ncbi:MAG: hypothetical protein A2Y25_04905 [Candidatus Melainabacteria bacterium GWF2_37_15]|nr:MAG: hypothetical protein A2Y25_04905 [Candidatus Melainabacteria bacterium GWF2_37_15]
MFEIEGYSSVYSNLLMNSLLVDNMFVNPPVLPMYNSYNDMLPDMLTTEIDDYYGEEYTLDISPEAYKLSIIDGLLPPGKW